MQSYLKLYFMKYIDSAKLAYCVFLMAVYNIKFWTNTENSLYLNWYSSIWKTIYTVFPRLCSYQHACILINTSVHIKEHEFHKSYLHEIHILILGIFLDNFNNGSMCIIYINCIFTRKLFIIYPSWNAYYHYYSCMYWIR